MFPLWRRGRFTNSLAIAILAVVDVRAPAQQPRRSRYHHSIGSSKTRYAEKRCPQNLVKLPEFYHDQGL